MGDRHGVRQVADLAYRSVGVDDLEQPALAQVLVVIQMRCKGLKAARLKPFRVVVDLIDDMSRRFREGFLGIVSLHETQIGWRSSANRLIIAPMSDLCRLIWCAMVGVVRVPPVPSAPPPS